MSTVFRRPTLAGLALLPVLVACSGVQPVTQPELSGSQLLDGFSEQAEQTTDQWWLEFNDEQLNALVTQALANNYSLKASLARLRQSEALLTVESAGQYPSLNLEAGKTRTWTENQTTNTNTTADAWSAGLRASYEIDFWGSVAASRDRAEYELFASRSSSRIQANTVASQVANSWFGYVHESNHLKLLEQQKQRIESGLKVINARFQRGQSQVSDVWQQQTLLESINGDLVSAQARRDIYFQQLQLWLAGEANIKEGAVLPSPDSAMTTQVAMQALFERPDVQQAYFNIQAANAGVAVAQANRYPRFTLSASYTGQDASFDNIFDNWVANLAGNLVLPLIDGGNRRAQVKSQQAALESRIADYQQTYLAAAQEVQQLLVKQQEQLQLDVSLSKQLELAQKTELFQTSRYRKGVGDYLSLLNAQREVLALERRLVSNKLAFNQTRISLYQAVSHGRFLPDDSYSGDKNRTNQEARES